MVIYLVSIVVAVPLCVWELQKLEVRGSCTIGLYPFFYRPALLWLPIFPLIPQDLIILKTMSCK